jgi:hypothetical protein
MISKKKRALHGLKPSSLMSTPDHFPFAYRLVHSRPNVTPNFVEVWLFETTFISLFIELLDYFLTPISPHQNPFCLCIMNEGSERNFCVASDAAYKKR